jgi:hypothetical protein
MSVSTFVQTDSDSQAVNIYPPLIDGDFSVLTRLGVAFAPHENATPDMTVALDAGHIFNGTILTEVGAQSTASLSPPTTYGRIDRVVVDRMTGIVSVVTGTESTSPTPPSIPVGSVPIAQVELQPSMATITNDLITDERDLAGLGTPAGVSGLLNIQVFSASGTYTPTAGTTKIVVEVQGAGGSGGGTAATTSSTGAASSGGGSGSYAKSQLLEDFAGALVTVGEGGAAPIAGANAGNAGGASSFGTFVTAPGGQGGNPSIAYTAPAIVGAPGEALPATGANIVGARGAQSNQAFILSSSVVVGGTGGASYFGGGGYGGGAALGGNSGTPGAGGGGSSSIANTAARSGGAGANGIVIVYEYA